MTDWWTERASGVIGPPPEGAGDPEPAPPPVVLPPVDSASEPESTGAASDDESGGRRVKLIAGAAAVLLAGALAVNAVGGDAAPTPVAEHGPVAEVDPIEELPPAGGPPIEAARRTDPTATVEPPPAAPAVVTLTVRPAGRGRVGAVVEVTIRNATDAPVVVMASLLRGDGRPAIVGEGTLAPGARTIAAGETAVGTVEFADARMPARVILVDLDGEVVAASGHAG